jgi:MoaA/NifB/PqqE/SkfB family radical SAM enzyme
MLVKMAYSKSNSELNVNMIHMNDFMWCVEMHLTELCNMKCSFCPRAHGYENENKHMSLETVKLVLDEMATFDFDRDGWNKNINKSMWLEPHDKFRLHLAGRGEPALHPQFKEILEMILHRKNTDMPHLWCKVSTNGSRIDKYYDLYKQLDAVNFSVYDECKISYHQAKIKYKDIRVSDRRTKNVMEKPKEFRILNNRAGSVPDLNINRSEYKGHVRWGKICHKPFNMIYVNWDGDYVLCCNDWRKTGHFTNIHNVPMLYFWNNDPDLNDYRNELLNGRRQNKTPCSTCYKRPDVSFLMQLQEALDGE